MRSPALLALLALQLGCAAGATAPMRGPALAPEADALPALYREDEVDEPAHPVEPITPVYPADLRALGLEGDVEAEVAVLADGTVSGARVIRSSHERFAESAAAALRDARFHPAMFRGRAVSSWVRVELHFRLHD
jgi:TonB family protein